MWNDVEHLSTKGINDLRNYLQVVYCKSSENTFQCFCQFFKCQYIDEEPCHGQWPNARLFRDSSDLIAIDLIFKSCENDGTDGLTFTEITGEACMEIIDSTFGVTEDNVNKIFKELDQDKNQIISKYEATTVGTSLLARKICRVHKTDI